MKKDAFLLIRKPTDSGNEVAKYKHSVVLKLIVSQNDQDFVVNFI